MIKLEKAELARIAEKRPHIMMPFNDLVERALIPTQEAKMRKEIYEDNLDAKVSNRIEGYVQDAVERYAKIKIPHF